MSKRLLDVNTLKAMDPANSIPGDREREAWN